MKGPVTAGERPHGETTERSEGGERSGPAVDRDRRRPMIASLLREHRRIRNGQGLQKTAGLKAADWQSRSVRGCTPVPPGSGERLRQKLSKTYGEWTMVGRFQNCWKGTQVAERKKELRTQVISAVAALSVLIALLGFLVHQAPRERDDARAFPECDSPSGIEQAKRAIGGTVDILRVSEAEEVRFDAAKKVRSCVAKVVTNRSDSDGDALLLYRFRDLDDQYLTWSKLYTKQDLRALSQIAAAYPLGDSEEARDIQDLGKYADIIAGHQVSPNADNGITADEFLKEYSKPGNGSAKTTPQATTGQTAADAGTKSVSQRAGVPVSADDFLRETGFGSGASANSDSTH